MPGIASVAIGVVINYVAWATKTIRVGAGGIMLPNHAPLAAALAFGTVESLYLGWIDLELGRVSSDGSDGTDYAHELATQISDDLRPPSWRSSEGSLGQAQ